MFENVQFGIMIKLVSLFNEMFSSSGVVHLTVKLLSFLQPFIAVLFPLRRMWSFISLSPMYHFQHSLQQIP
jgi:hypothetical protein